MGDLIRFPVERFVLDDDEEDVFDKAIRLWAPAAPGVDRRVELYRELFAWVARTPDPEPKEWE